VDSLSVVVVDRRPAAEGVVSLTLAAADGALLPAWTPGAHIDVILPSGLIRQYSLCGAPTDLTHYRIAVLREEISRGGSEEVHAAVTVGTRLALRGPRNHFPLTEDADDYLFIAGGVGITPILPMVRDIAAARRPWRLIYGGRRLSSMAFLDEVVGLHGGQVEILPEDEAGRPDLDVALAARGPRTAVYCCGPEGLLRSVEDNCASRGITDWLHLERFGANSALPIPVATGGSSFEVRLAKTGVTLVVPPDRSLLSVVQEVLPDVPFSCTEGICGTCETEVLEGVPEHRDEVLSDDERDANDTMMICVGRSKTPRLVLNL
jgi:ferredoxin-NADP reductase